MSLLNYFKRPIRFDYLLRFIASNQKIKVMDIGCGNNSAYKTKLYFPNCEYHGLDKIKNCNNDAINFKLMEKFYQIDLDNSKLNELPDNYYDCIIFSHVIEHLTNGLDLLELLINKLAQNGIIYIETPSQRSLSLPSMKGVLNFWDDPTHIKVYDLNEMVGTLRQKNCQILYSKTRRSLKRILFFPAYTVYSLFKNRYIISTVFWDLLGFANIVIAKKTFNEK